MRLPILLLLAAAVTCGCEQGPRTVQTTNKPITAPSAEASPAAQPAASESQPVAADNTAVNARDNDPAAKTPIDQNESEADLKVTADIRKKVLEQPDFSVDARNVKIITADGKVTLRGPVKTEAERDIINKIARLVAGEDKVDSQLEIAP